MPSLFKLIAGILLGATAGMLHARPVITSVTLSPTTVTLLFDDDGSSNQFELQTNPSLDPANWSSAPSAVRTDLGNNKFRYTIARTAATRQFFRIIGSFLGTGVDRDGDGLPNDLETSTTNTNPDRADTDGDGFSDGVEFSLGTNPNLASSVPVLANVPAVQFVSSVSQFEEGTTPVHRVQLTFDQPFQGTVLYTVDAASTMTAPADYTALSGALSFNGTTGFIDIPVTDDFVIKPSRFLVLKLTTRPLSAGYRVGGGAIHVCSVIDDDAYWTGSLKDELLVRDFRLRILRKAGQPSQVAFVSGSADGRPVIDGGTSSQSTGIIPQTPQAVWTAEGVADTATLFTANSPVLPAIVSALPGMGTSTSTITDEALTRRLLLTASQALAPAQSVNRQRIILGRFTEQVRALNPAITYLNLDRTGSMVLIRDIAGPPQYTPPNIPNP